jgi:hypothetical protein
MVRHSAFTSMFKIVIALLAALLLVGIGTVTVPAGAHDCGCQTDNSGPGSNGPDNSGPGNACHDNSGPGSTTSGSSGSSGSSDSGSDSSGPGSGDECPMDDPGDDPGDSGDNAGNDSNDTGTTSGGTVVQGAQASVRSSSPTQAGAEVPTAVSAGLTGPDSEESPSVLAGLAILLGLTMTIAAVARRRTRA